MTIIEQRTKRSSYRNSERFQWSKSTEKAQIDGPQTILFIGRGGRRKWLINNQLREISRDEHGGEYPVEWVSMKKILVVTAITVALAAATASTARAGISFGINIGIPVPAVVVPARPVCVPAPPICAPPVVVAPAPVYYPAPVYPRHYRGHTHVRFAPRYHYRHHLHHLRHCH